MHHEKPETEMGSNTSIDVEINFDKVGQKTDDKINVSKESEPVQKNKTPENDDLTKIRNFIREMSDNKNSDLIPVIDYTTNSISYPVLKNLTGSYDIDFIEKMTKTQMDMIEKYIYERIIVCEEHPTNFKVSPKLACPKCNSSNIEKYQLIEHRICGFISEVTKFNAAGIHEIVSCPSCKKEIRNPQKELRIPGMWYKCNQCNEKISNPITKFRCWEFDHDFTINGSQLISIPAYKVVKTDSRKIKHLSVLEDVKQILQSDGFMCLEFSDVKGKSGLVHKVEILGIKNQKQINVFIKESEKEFDDNEIKSLLLDLIDLPSDITILIAIPTISPKAKTILSNYKISVITGESNSEISDKFKEEINKKMMIQNDSVLG